MWLAGYIKLNTEMRKKAKNTFSKDFYEPIDNFVFGKAIELMKKHIRMKLLAGERKLQKLINKPTFKYCTPCEENLQTVSMENKIIDFCKPVFIGFGVLKVSKSLIYNYHYNAMKKHYNDKIKLLYTDKDSLVYHVQTEDFDDDLAKNPVLLDRMDTANLSLDHPCYIPNQKKIPGYFSNEFMSLQHWDQTHSHTESKSRRRLRIVKRSGRKRRSRPRGLENMWFITHCTDLIFWT